MSVIHRYLSKYTEKDDLNATMIDDVLDLINFISFNNTDLNKLLNKENYESCSTIDHIIDLFVNDLNYHKDIIHNIIDIDYRIEDLHSSSVMVIIKYSFIQKSQPQMNIRRNTTS